MYVDLSLLKIIYSLIFPYIVIHCEVYFVPAFPEVWASLTLAIIREGNESSF